MHNQNEAAHDNREKADPKSKSENRPAWLNVLLFALAIAAGTIAYCAAPQELTEAQRRMMGIFIVALVLWVSESIPLFATSLLVIVSESWLIAMPGASDATIDYTLFFGALSNPVIFIFLGGFILAKAVQQEKIDIQMAALLMRPFGTRPAGVLAGLMVITAVFSMFMSNTATTAMMIVLVQPLLAQIPEGDRFRRGLILAVPFAANIGGVGTPIGTPPNAIALAQLDQLGFHIGFATWMACTVPLLIGALIVLWFILMAAYRPRVDLLRVEVPKTFHLSFKACTVYMTFAVTVLLWLTSALHGIPTAVVAGLPAAVLTATRVIGRRQFNRLEWDILVLIAGGIALGTGITSTNLDTWIISLLPDDSISFLWLSALSCIVVVCLSTVISNTVTTNLVLPIVLAIASISASSVQLQSFAIMLAVTSSFAMGLPISTPPNAIAYGSGQISSRDILVIGGITSCIATAFIIATGPWILALMLG
jgi:sodium-dependent dicarboxylate transporter 2/3/5